MKTAVAAVCVVAAGMGAFKAYGFANQSQADMLLAENVEALSQKDGDKVDNAKTNRDWVPTGRAVTARGFIGIIEICDRYDNHNENCILNDTRYNFS